MRIQYILDGSQEVIGLQEMVDILHDLFGLKVHIDQLLDMNIVGLGDYFVAFAVEVVDRGEGARLMLGSAAIVLF